MSVYTQQNLGANLSTFAGTDDAQDEAIRSHERGSTEPTTKVNGLVWFSTDSTSITAAGFSGVTEAALRWNGSAWVGLMDLAGKQINALGTVAWAADQAMGSHKLTGLSAGSAAGHSVRYEQVMLLSGVNAMSGNLAMGSNKITGLANGTAASDAATFGQLPVNGANIYHNNNRDTGGGGDPVVWKTSNGDTTNFMTIGFKPKQITIRVEGNFRKVSDNSDTTVDVDEEETTVLWFPADATGGDGGREFPSNVKTWVSGGGA